MTMNLRRTWDLSADEWLRWARPRGFDHYYWYFNKPEFMKIVPDPGRLTIEVGCGEGRLTRELQQQGHHVLGIDGSPTLSHSAATGGMSIEAVVADAARLPVRSEAADLVIAFMVLHDVDDLDRSVQEVGRVLVPGGRFCLAVIHPLASAGALTAGSPLPYAITDSYFADREYQQVTEIDGATMTFHSVHRPLSAYTRALEKAGFLLEVIREPKPRPFYVKQRPEVERWRNVPLFLHIRAVRQ